MINQFDEFSASPSAEASDKVPETVKGVSDVARLQYLIDNTPAIIYSSVPTGDFKMTFVSNNALNVLGYHPEEMLADPNFWFNHIHPADVPQIFSSIAKLFTEGERVYEYRFMSRAGQYVWMHDMLRLIRDEDGNPVEVIGSLTDITKRKEMEETLFKKGQEQQLLIKKLQEAHEQLLQSEKMASVGQLAAGIAHEINNPIGFINSNIGSLHNYVEKLLEVIGGYEDLIPQSLSESQAHCKMNEIRERADLDFLKDDIQDLVQESMDGLKRVKDIVQSLKDFSHVGETDWQEADIHHGIDSTLNIVKNEIKYKANVVKEYGQLPPVKCIISQVNQVIMNLLVNASHAIKEKGIIKVSTGCEKDLIWIKVLDTGSGISPENLNRIFEPFFTTKPIGSGTGLGLSLSYGIIKKHGGKIDVNSVPGKGTCFTVWLPLRQENNMAH
ncbi:hypothetical protein UNDKW_2312 [Undibacterium sp. KW1]|uniref:ATP-binding protein n=1 Tax=Undibacterium sp. KW1 TaxID=2058624 RepID=UPI001331DBEF|nr:ATP-binding protein [Undibacterium sp. KW1]BBB60585.1 hypothetical protein UNDKW_2312 [Undibacterium sp. KW1]